MSNKNQSLLKEIKKSGILRLILNEPKNKNALSKKMISKLKEAISFASSDDLVKVIIIAANGNVYSAGHDLKEITEARFHNDDGNSYFRDLFNSCSDLMKLIVESPKPIIAEVNGVATAAGCQLVASCDLAISSDDSRFATPGVNIGLFCSTPMVALSRSVSNKHSMEMLLTGELISSEKAKQIGLINECVEDNQLQNFVSEIATKITKKSSLTLKIGKEAFYRQVDMTLSDAYDYASNVMVENMLKYDAEEGINAFIEKRKPSWKDK